LICLGVDPGQKRIGLALGQGTLAVSLDSVTSEDALVHIRELTRQRNVDRIYVGLPLNLKGLETKSTSNALEFAKQLQGELQLPIFLIDERLTTAASARMLRNAGLSSRQTRDYVDSDSARLLVEQAISLNHKAGVELEDYLAGRL